MKRISLLAGFFILASSFPGLASTIQTDTLPGKTLQFYNLTSNNFRLSFYNWRNSQQRNLLIRPVAIDLRSQLILKLIIIQRFVLAGGRRLFN